jgi:threonine/homoserine/homoserine lactone efflux protein
MPDRQRDGPAHRACAALQAPLAPASTTATSAPQGASGLPFFERRRVRAHLARGPSEPMVSTMYELLLPLTLFALAGTATPGPNNVMLTASGASFGFRRSLPHMLGITVGFPVMIIAVGLGLGEVFTRYPQLHLALKYVGAAYLLYLAWRIAQASDPDAGEAGGKPLTFLEAAGFQWVNPKAWMLALSTIPAFTTVGGNYYVELGIIAAVYGAICMPSCAAWCLFGVAIRQLVNSPETARVVNLVLAGLVAASVVLLFI